MTPQEYKDFDEFSQFVKTQLGDVVVMDDNKFISDKIKYYWAAWRSSTDVYKENEAGRWSDLLKARRTYVTWKAL